MKMLLCAVFDSKVSAFAPPFAVKTRGEAIRSFTEGCRDPASMLAKYPADYRLFLLGEYDDNTGSVLPIQPEPIIGADEIG